MLNFLNREIHAEKMRLLEENTILREESKKLQDGVRLLETERAATAAPMYIVDKDLLITYINDATLFVMGYRRDEVVGRMTCADFSRTLICGTNARSSSASRRMTR